MTDEWTDADDLRLRNLFHYQLRAHVKYQDGRDSSAPALVFADADYEVGDGTCGLHPDGKQANEPAIVYVRTDALIDAHARLRELEAHVARLSVAGDASAPVSVGDVMTDAEFASRCGSMLIFSGHPEDYPLRVKAEQIIARHLPAALAETAHCCVCGAFVDTREIEDGGDTEGCQLSDGAWVCSSECWDAAQ